MFDELRGKSVLINGAGTGIVAALARGFGRCGARVGLHWHRSAGAGEDLAAVPDAGGAAAVLQSDITNKPDVGGIINAHVQEFGRLDVLINDAGDVVRRSPSPDFSRANTHPARSASTPWRRD